jgi:hypothetical protein
MNAIKWRSKVGARWLRLSPLLAALAGGCGASGSGNIETEDDMLQTVELRSDDNGGYLVRTFTQSRAQRQREEKVRAERAINFREGIQAAESHSQLSKDVSCIDWDAFWAFPELGQLGTRCCISGTGTANFASKGGDASVGLACGFEQARSFYAGIRPGVLGDVPWCTRPFSAYEQDDLSCWMRLLYVAP